MEVWWGTEPVPREKENNCIQVLSKPHANSFHCNVNQNTLEGKLPGIYLVFSSRCWSRPQLHHWPGSHSTEPPLRVPFYLSKDLALSRLQGIIKGRIKKWYCRVISWGETGTKRKLLDKDRPSEAILGFEDAVRSLMIQIFFLFLPYSLVHSILCENVTPLLIAVSKPLVALILHLYF